MPNTESRPTARQIALAAGTVLLLLTGVHVLVPDGALGAVTYVLASASAAAAAWFAVIRRGPLPRRAWMLIAAGVLGTAIGDVLHVGGIALHAGNDTLSLADPLYLVSYVLLGLGINRLTWVPAHRRRASDIDAVIDVAAVGLAVSVAAWLFLVEPMFEARSIDRVTHIVSATSPILDVILLTLLARVLASSTSLTRAAQVLLVGVFCWLAADLATMVDVHVGGTGDSALIDAGYILGTALLACAAWVAPSMRVPEPTELADADHRPIHSVTWLVLPLLAPLVMSLVLEAQGRSSHALILVCTNIALGALLLARWTRLVDSRGRAIEAVERQERYHRTISASSSDAVLVLDGHRRVVHDSPTLAELLPRVAERDRVGADLIELLDPVDRAEVEAMFNAALADLGDAKELDVELSRPGNEVRSVSLRVVNLLDDPIVDGLVVAVQDSTERRLAAEALTRQALHDSLTGLANRVLFRDRLDHALARRARSGIEPAVIFLDVDGFKQVNDSLGHEAGDELLCALAERISAAVRGDDTVARLGGDEFAILIEGSRRPLDDAIAASERVIQAISAPVAVAGRMVSLSASLGIEVASDGQDATAVLRNADVAMYRSKALGKGRWMRYDPTMRAVTLERLALEADLVAALERREMRIVYQPIVELTTRRLTGFEALLRWDHPRFGILAPDTFIPLAEETGVIGELGEWVLHQACAAGRRWQVQVPADPPLTMAVNLSGVQLASDHLAVQVAAALEAGGLPPSSLILELTEQVLVADPLGAGIRLRELRDLGVRVAIDDFGTGYSSLSYLTRFPVDMLKIDRSFVVGVSEESELPAMVRGLLDLGRTLDLDVVASGIENSGQLGRLLERGDGVLGQGFLFAEPLTPIEVDRLLFRGVSFPSAEPLGAGRGTDPGRRA